MVTHVKADIIKQKVWVSKSLTVWTAIEPTRVSDALAMPQWKAAMDAGCHYFIGPFRRHNNVFFNRLSLRFLLSSSSLLLF
ncbi:unnamed protein product [Citrullus colocynthis]|uniref:Uncharacterized protein n=1 Tax=Citrullus colocynthis TaxID=252529 RepID=A0ABP0Z5W2_9ROSI